MNSEPHIRLMTADDIPAVVALADSLPSAPHWPQSTYQFALNPASLPERIALGAVGNAGALAGFAVASITGSESELESIVVAPGFQRQGTARALFRHLVITLSQRDVRTVFLEVRASNEPAIGLYSSLGFIQSGHRKAYYTAPVEDALVYRLQIEL